MPHKLKYSIERFSSEDQNGKVLELLVQGPAARGWASAKFSVYPQEIILQLSERSHLSRIQLLAHHALIPERVELQIGDAPPGEEVTLKNAQFSLLGYISLSPNNHTDHKARELKSVGVDCTGSFLKMVVHKNHLNKLNKYNQVALVAVNVIGNEVEDNNNSVSPDGEGGRVPSRRPPKAGSSSSSSRDDESKDDDVFPAYDDLAFSMYVDTDVTAVIQQIELKKEAAKREGRSEYCRRLQEASQLLQIAGKTLGKYEIEKRLAIDNEFFDKAKLKGQYIEDYREEVYNTLDIDALLEKKGKLDSNDSPDHSDSPTLPPIPGSRPNTLLAPKSASPRLPKSPNELPPARPAHSPPVHPPPTPPRPYSPEVPRLKATTPLPDLRSHRDPSPGGDPTPRPGAHYGRSPGGGRATSAPTPPSGGGYDSYDERTLPALKQ